MNTLDIILFATLIVICLHKMFNVITFAVMSNALTGFHYSVVKLSIVLAVAIDISFFVTGRLGIFTYLPVMSIIYCSVMTVVLRAQIKIAQKEMFKQIESIFKPFSDPFEDKSSIAENKINNK